jgi:hypothetical protein
MNENTSMPDFTLDEMTLLYESVNAKMGRLFRNRLAQKSAGNWDEFEEELYLEEFKNLKPLWDKLYQCVKG